MPDAASLTLFLPSEEATTRLGVWLAAALGPGDVLLLEGSIGAGKTHLCRALIRAALGRAEDVPSPTFTLVQTYDAPGHQIAGHQIPGHEIWHADLYRLTHPDEVLELGLEAAFATALCLVEWPDRLGDLAPPDAIRLTLRAEGEGRQAQFLAPGRSAMLARLAQEWARDD